MVPRESKQQAYAVSGLFLSVSVRSLKRRDLYTRVWLLFIHVCVGLGCTWDGMLAVKSQTSIRSLWGLNIKSHYDQTLYFIETRIQTINACCVLTSAMSGQQPHFEVRFSPCGLLRIAMPPCITMLCVMYCVFAVALLNVQKALMEI